MSAEAAMLAALLVPTAGAGLIGAARRHPDLRETVTLVTAALLFVCVLAVTGPVLDGARPSIELFQVLPGIGFAFRAEPLGMLFALVASSLWIVNSLYSIGYMRANAEGGQTRFYICFALALACTMGIAFAANLLTLFLFYEALTLITWPLVTHHRDDEAIHGGRVYLAYLLGTSMALLLVAIVATWILTGSVEFTPGGIVAGRLSEGAVGALLALYVFGIGKAAVMPFHRWLPAAMVAPTPVSALLHAVAVVKAGVFTVVKVVVYIFGVSEIAGLASLAWLPVVAGFTLLAASVVALRADNLKRRLAYSTVSQLAYVVLATALLTPLSVLGAALHIAAHAFGKITLFFAAGAIYTAAHKTNVSELDGIGRRMPWTMGAFTLGALSLIGIPPCVGFLSKWFMIQGAFQTGMWTVAAVFLASTLLNAAYFMPIVYAAFFRPAAGKAHGEAPLTMVVALSLTAAGTVALFFVPDVPLALARSLAGLP
jgi:multicomponent Na+:H+ antiporter subunit D